MDIAIVGGGASAACFVNALTHVARLPPGRLTVFEPSARLWRGRAYQRDHEVVRLNSPASDMSVRRGDDGHFERWLNARHPSGADAQPHGRARFVPRTVYGDYLEHAAREAMRTLARSGWQVGVVPERVDFARPTGDGVVLCTSGGRIERHHRAVLCFGAGTPPDVYGLAGTPGYVPEPFPVADRLADIDRDAEVTVIGSGLTAVDVVLALDALGHRGAIRLVSRRGILPAVRPYPAPHCLRHFTPAYFRRRAARGERVPLADVVDLLAAELAEAGADLGTIRAEIDSVVREDPIARLRRHLDGVGSTDMALRILQQAVPACGPELWRALGEQDKEFLLEAHHRTTMSLCCPMPPSSAHALLALVDNGRLRIARDVSGIAPRPGGGFTVSAGAAQWHADTVVNALSARMNRNPPRTAARLVASLVTADVAETHPRGGIAVEPRTSALTAAGRPDPRLFALGDPGMGSLFFTFGVPSLVDRSADIVRALADQRVQGEPRLSRPAVAHRAPSLLPIRLRTLS